MVKKRAMRGAKVAAKPPEKIGGASFGIMLGFAMMKDLLDILITFLAAVFLVMPVVVTAIAAAVSETVDALIVLVLVGPLFGIIISIAIFFYLFFNGVRWNTKKLSIQAISFIVEILPFLGFLPMATMNLFLIRKMENAERVERSRA